MEDVLFSRPVLLNLKTTGHRKVDSVYEAIEAMQGAWPAHSSDDRTYHAALRICRDALDGWQTGSRCRRTFVRAARKARIGLTDF